MIRAVLFDFDDTLVDFSPSDAKRLFREGASRCYAYLSAHELALPTFETFCRQQRWIARKIEWIRRLSGGEPDMRRILRRICRDYRLQRDQVSLAKLGWLWYEPIAEHASVAADVVPTLRALQAGGIELGLVVNSAYPGAVIDQHLEDLGLLEFFPTRAYSTDVGARKPDARLFNAALESMHVKAAEAIFVGDDARLDILGARRVGMATVHRTGRADRSTVADHVIAKLSELLELPELSRLRETRQPAPVVMPALLT
jgi:HAD superfamily hydrolase (TIGR01549 family)